MTYKTILLSAFALLLAHLCNAQVVMPDHRLPSLSNPALYPQAEAAVPEGIDLGYGTYHLPRAMSSNDPPAPDANYMILDEDWGRPGWAMHFRWDTLTAAWDSVLYSTHAYSPNGNLVETMRWTHELGALHLVNRTTHTYDNSGRVSKTVGADWDGNAWIFAGRFDFHYDAIGNRTMRDMSTWNGTGWDVIQQDSNRYTYVLGELADTVEWVQWTASTNNWDNMTRYTYHYTSDSLQDRYQFIYWDGSNWMNLRRYDYTYDTNRVLATTTEFIGQGTIWGGPNNRIEWTSWHDYSKLLPAVYMKEEFNGTNPSNFLRYSNYYSLYDSRIEYAENQNWQGGWDTIYAMHLDYDVNARFTAMEFYTYWAGWSKYSGWNRNFVYDTNNNIIEYWEEHFSRTTGLYTNTERLLFDDYFGVTGVEDSGPVLSKVVAYPNPCTDQLRFVLDVAQDEPVRISLYDVEGRLRVQTSAAVTTGGEVAMPISEVLENGAYVYRLQTNAGYMSGKVVVQR